MVNIGGNDGATTGDFAAHEFGLDFFAFGNEGHLFGDDAFAGQMHLRHVFIAIGRGRFRFSFFDPAVTQCHRAPSERSRSGRAGSGQTSLLRVKTKYGIGVG